MDSSHIKIRQQPMYKFRNEIYNSRATTKEATTYLHRVFHALGINMTETNKAAYVCYAIFIHCVTTIFLPVTFTASYFMESNRDLSYDVIFTSIQVAVNIYGCSTKICMLLFFIPKLKGAERVMAKLDERCQENDEVMELFKMRHTGRKIVVLFTMAFMSYAISTYISSLIAGVPPYSLYLPYIDWRRSHWEYHLASFIEYVLMSWACFQQVGNDSYATVYVCILRYHVKILLLRIQKMGSKPEKSLDENIEELKMVIQDHKNLIELYNIISPVISCTIFLQFSLTAGILGITLLNVLIFAETVGSITASGFYILAVVVEIFPLCYNSNGLLYDSYRMGTEIFHSQWISQDIRYKKMMIFFMQRSQKDMELWAGKIFPINLNSFISIAKFSFSLYTLVKKMGIKEKLGL